MGLLRRVARKVASTLGGGAPAPARPAAPAPPRDEPVAEAEAFASIECGAQELKERLDAGEEVVIVDVRGPGEAARGSLPGARALPLSQLEARWQELADADEIVCTDAGDGAAVRAARLLRAKGLINATALEGGVQAWTAVGGRLAPLG